MKFKFWHTGLALLLVALMAGACKKGSDVVGTQYNAYLDVINATDSVFNIYQNGTRLNSTANIYIAASSGYLTVPVATPTTGQVYSFKRPINVYAAYLTAPANLFSKTLTLDSNRHYSLFVTGNTAASAFLIKDADTSLVSNTSYAKVRFAHMAPSLGTVSVTLNGTTKFSGATYGSVSNFTTVAAYVTPAGVSTNTAVINVYVAGNTVPVATFTQSLQSGSVYTLFVKDNKSSTGTTYTAGYIVNR